MDSSVSRERIASIVAFVVVFGFMVYVALIFTIPPPPAIAVDNAYVYLTENGYTVYLTLSGDPSSDIYISGIEYDGNLEPVGLWASPGKPIQIPISSQSPPQRVKIYSIGSTSGEVKTLVDIPDKASLDNIYSVILNNKLYIALNATLPSRAYMVFKPVSWGVTCYVVPTSDRGVGIERYVPEIVRIDISKTSNLSLLMNCSRMAFLDSYPSQYLLSYMRNMGFSGSIYIGFTSSEYVSRPYEISISNNSIVVTGRGNLDTLFGGFQCVRAFQGDEIPITGARDLRLAHILGLGGVFRSYAFYQSVPSCMALVDHIFFRYQSGFPAVVYTKNKIAVLGAGSPLGLAFASYLDLVSLPPERIGIMSIPPFKGIRFLDPLPPLESIGVVLTTDREILGVRIIQPMRVEASCGKDICTALFTAYRHATEKPDNISIISIRIFEASYNGSVFREVVNRSGVAPISLDLPRVDGLYIAEAIYRDRVYRFALGYMEKPSVDYNINEVIEFFSARVTVDSPISFSRIKMLMMGSPVDGSSIPTPPSWASIYIVSGGLVLDRVPIKAVHFYEDQRILLTIGMIVLMTIVSLAYMRGSKPKTEQKVTLVLRYREKQLPISGREVIEAILSSRGGCATDREITAVASMPEEAAALMDAAADMVARGEVSAEGFNYPYPMIAISVGNPYTCLLYKVLKACGDLVGVPVSRVVRTVNLREVSWISLADAAASIGVPPKATMNLYFFQRMPGIDGIAEVISRFLEAIYRISESFPNYNINLGVGRISGLYIVPLPQDYKKVCRILYGLIPLRYRRNPNEYKRISEETRNKVRDILLTPDAVSGATHLEDLTRVDQMLSNFAIAVALPWDLSLSFISLYSEEKDSRKYIEDSINMHYEIAIKDLNL